jgi:hypothetical protein
MCSDIAPDVINPHHAIPKPVAGLSRYIYRTADVCHEQPRIDERHGVDLPLRLEQVIAHMRSRTYEDEVRPA